MQFKTNLGLINMYYKVLYFRVIIDSVSGEFF